MIFLASLVVFKIHELRPSNILFCPKCLLSTKKTVPFCQSDRSVKQDRSVDKDRYAKPDRSAKTDRSVKPDRSAQTVLLTERSGLQNGPIGRTLRLSDPGSLLIFSSNNFLILKENLII